MPDIGGLVSSPVIFLYGVAEGAPIGTAFVVGYPVPGLKDAFVPLVVTARHVIGDRTELFGRFSGRDDCEFVYMQYDLAHLKGSGDYWEHPDSGVDIGVFRSGHMERMDYHVLPFDLVASKEDFAAEDIKTTDRVLFPSLLVNFMGLSRNLPVVRDGSIALIPDEPVPLKYTVGERSVVTQQEVILLDATAIRGASGSPVYLWPGPRLKRGAFVVGGARPLLIGVVHGFYPAVPEEAVQIQTGTKTFYSENSGIAILFPSWRLREILELPALAERIAEASAAELDRQHRKNRAPSAEA